jgi:hypothetical protein
MLWWLGHNRHPCKVDFDVPIATKTCQIKRFVKPVAGSNGGHSVC